MLEVKEILGITKGKLLNGSNQKISRYCIDSRECDEETFFIPLIGEKVDGHEYIDNIKKIKGFFINTNYIKKEEVVNIMKKKDNSIIIIEVEDTYKALLKISELNIRKNSDIVKIAITGSVGKTSTREMLAAVLSQKYNIIKTIKNYNSEIGVAMMGLMTENQQIGIYEMGMDGFGQIDVSSKIIKPDYAVITNIGTAHIGIFGSRHNTLKAKLASLC